MKFEAVGNNVVLKKLESAKMAGSIHLPENTKTDEYVIYHVGSACEDEWEVGQRVIIDKFNSQQFKASDTEELIVVHEDKIRVRVIV